MSGRPLQQILPLLGSDLRLDYHSSAGFFEDADLSTHRTAGRGVRAVDLSTTDGLDNLTQALANRLKTRKGELGPLGHPDYGSRHHELIGEPNTERTRNLIKLYILQALRDEARIERVLSATVRAEHVPPRDSVRIEISARVRGQPDPLNLVVPFFLTGSP